MKIKLNKSEWLDDWYLIVRAEHDGLAWVEETGPNSGRFMSSERLSPEACIEGTANEMLAIADAIKSRGSARFNRCAVMVKDDVAYFCSPKNSEHDAAIPLVEADAFAEQVFKELRGMKIEPVAAVVPCYTPSGKRVALNADYQDLKIGTVFYTEAQLRQAMEACAAVCDKHAEQDKFTNYFKVSAFDIRNLIKEMLP